MPQMVDLQTIKEERGCLTVIEKVLPFQVRRVFYIYRVPAGAARGRHAHKTCRMALVALGGICDVTGHSPDGRHWSYRLDDPSRCLVLEPGDWREMRFLEPETMLLCLASEEFDPADHVNEPSAPRTGSGG